MHQTSQPNPRSHLAQLDWGGKKTGRTYVLSFEQEITGSDGQYRENQYLITLWGEDLED